jgi:hypothetical protein
VSKVPRHVMLREKDVNLWWYPISLVPLLVVIYFAFTGGLPQIVGLLAIFLFFFWVFSFAFALYVKLRKPPNLRQ